MRVGLDVMGGDHAPLSNLEGALAVLPKLEPDDRIALIGDEVVIRDFLREHNVLDDPHFEVISTTQVISMDESPVEAVRSKPDSSVSVGAESASRRRAERQGTEPFDAFLSAGNTGACVSAAQMHMRRLKNVMRPGIAVTIPSFAGPVVLLDAGANIEPKPQHLAQYGVMGEAYARLIVGIEKPRVALMNIGGEAGKGTTGIKQARMMLESDERIDFIGYIEGRGLFDGHADVVVTDGVVGNVMLKLAEGLSAGIFRAIVQEVTGADQELAGRFKPILGGLIRRLDYHEYGAAPLLGVDGICLISHGSSEPRGIANAILRARRYVDSHLNDEMVSRLESLRGSLEEVPA